MLCIFTLTNGTVSGALVRHDVRSRAANAVITGNVITDTAGTASYEIDLPNGGNALIDRNVIQKNTAAQNPIAISYGEEGMSYASNSLVVSNNLVVQHLHGAPRRWPCATRRAPSPPAHPGTRAAPTRTPTT